MQGATVVFRSYGVEVSDIAPAELKKARNRLLTQHHPDHAGSTKDTQRINVAYDILSGKRSASAPQSTMDVGPGEPADSTKNTAAGTPIWANAGYSGGARPHATIFQTNYTDTNFIKKSMWELSGESQLEYAIWGYDGAVFRNVVSVYGSRKIFPYMATAMIELQTKGAHPSACHAVIVSDKGNVTFWLIYADGRYFDDPINLEHNSLHDNPRNDQSFEHRLSDLLGRLREQEAHENK